MAKVQFNGVSETHCVESRDTDLAKQMLEVSAKRRFELAKDWDLTCEHVLIEIRLAAERGRTSVSVKSAMDTDSMGKTQLAYIADWLALRGFKTHEERDYTQRGFPFIKLIATWSV